MEFRLEESLRLRQTLADAMADALGGKRAAALFLELAAVARQWNGDESWLDNRVGFDTVREQWNEILERRAPLPSDEVVQRTNAARWIIERLKTSDHLAPEFPLNRDALIQTLIQLSRGMPPGVREEISAAVADADATDQRE
jgi:hypothetical protein